MRTVDLKVLGGGSEIGANSYILSADGHEVILDCGVHPKKHGRESLPEVDSLTRAPEAVIVSHAHVDHCGAIPYLVRSFPDTYVYATQPTVRIMDRMLHNSVSVMGTLAQEEGIEDYPLYGHQDVDFAIRRAYGMELEEEFALTFDSPVRAEFHHAGHVLGSAAVLLKFPEHTVFYTGDICLTPQELLSGHRFLPRDIEVDTLIVETTRATQENGSAATYQGEVERLAAEADKVLRTGGTVLVPSFALGRAQEILNIISRLMDEGRLPFVPVYASGLGRAIYEIYDRYRHYLKPGAALCPLDEFNSIGDVWDRQVVRDLIQKPSIIVATSGMMVENTPSAMIARELVREKRHGIFFVGYLDPETLGYRLLHANVGDELAFSRYSDPVEVRLANRQSFNFSAHASREDLGAIIDHVSPKNVVFVHGDPEAVEWMYSHSSGDYRKFAPVLGETISLGA